MVEVNAMKIGALSTLAMALAVSPAISAKRHHVYFSQARAEILDMTRVNLHPVYDLYRPVSVRTFDKDRIPTEKTFAVSRSLTGSFGYHTSPAAGAVPATDVNQAAAMEYGAGDKTVGAAVGMKF